MRGLAKNKKYVYSLYMNTTEQQKTNRDIYLEPETNKFKKGNPGKPKGCVPRRDKILKSHIQEVVRSLAQVDGIKRLINVILQDILRSYDPVRFRKWLKKEENETLYFTKILPHFFPSSIDIKLEGDVEHKLTYELILPQLIQMKERGLIDINAEKIQFEVAKKGHEVIEAEVEDGK